MSTNPAITNRISHATPHTHHPRLIRFAALALTFAAAATNSHAETFTWTGLHPSSSDWDAKLGDLFFNWAPSHSLPGEFDIIQLGNNFPGGGFASGTPTLGSPGEIRLIDQLYIDHSGDVSLLNSFGEDIDLNYLERRPTSTGTHRIHSFADFHIDGTTTFNIQGSGALILEGSVLGSGPSTTLIKTGDGTLRFEDSITSFGDPNTDIGLITVSGGVLQLARSGSIPGNLTIDASATAKQFHDSTISDDSLVTINGGTYHLNDFTETINTLDLQSGELRLTNGDLTTTTFTDTGAGTIFLGSGSRGSLTIKNGNLASDIHGDGVIVKNSPGTLDFSSNVLDTVALEINNGTVTTTTPIANNLDSPITIKNLGTLNLDDTTDTTLSRVLTGAGQLLKTGPAVITIGGSENNTNTSLTTVDDGQLHLNKPDGTDAIGGDLLINTATVRLLQNNQIPDAATVTIDGGFFRLNGFNETIDTLDLQFGDLKLDDADLTATTITDTGTADISFGDTSTTNKLTLHSGNLASDIDGQGSLVKDGPGTLNVTANAPDTVQIVINDGTLTIPTPTINQFDTPVTIHDPGTLNLDDTTDTTLSRILTGTGQLHKTGPANTTIGGGGAGNNTNTGLTTVDNGELQFNKAPGTNAIGGNLLLNTGAAARLLASNQIPVTATVTLDGGTFRLVGLNETVDTLDLQDGDLRLGNGNLTTTTFTDTAAGAIFLGVGSTTNTLTIQNGNLAATISGEGIIVKDGTGTLDFSSNVLGTAALQINNGTVTTTTTAADNLDTPITINDPGTLNLNDNTDATLTRVLTGDGHLLKTGTAATTLGTGGIADNTNTGPTTIDNGELRFDKADGTQALGGDLLINTGAKSQHLNSNQLPDTATVTLDGGTFDLNARTETIDTLNLNAGTLRIANGDFTAINFNDTAAGTIDLGAVDTTNTFNVHNGNIASDLTQKGTLFKRGTGTLTFTGNVTDQAKLRVNNGIFTTKTTHLNNFDPNVTINTLGTLRLDDTTDATLTRVPTGDGQLLFAGTATTTIGTGGAAHNTNTGLTTLDGGSIQFNKAPGTNAIGGDLLIDTAPASQAKWLADNQLPNTATVTVDTGIINLNAHTETINHLDLQTNGTLNLNNGTLTANTITAAGQITGNGTINADLTTTGTTTPGTSPGIINLTGTYTATPTATLQIEVTNATPPIPGTDHDQINISGSVTLNGTLEIIPLPDPTTFAATPLGTTFDILTYTTRTGFFTNITGTLLNTAFALAPLINATDDTLQLRATIPGDLNLDNKVSVADLAEFALNFDTTPGLHNELDNKSSWLYGDFNTDGAITVADLSLLALNFGFDATDPTSASPISLTDAATLAGIDPTTIPEPHSLALLTTLALLLTKRQPTAP